MSADSVTPDLLAILHPDPVVAEQQYRRLLSDLTRAMEWRGCHDPEGVAAEAVYRGLKKAAAGVDLSQAGLRGFVFGIAKLVAKEGWKRDTRAQQLAPETWEQMASRRRDHEAAEAQLTLASIQRVLPEQEWQMLLRYSTETDHEDLCRELGVEPGYLRVKIHRLRKQLRPLAAGALPRARSRATGLPKESA